MESKNVVDHETLESNSISSMSMEVSKTNESINTEATFEEAVTSLIETIDRAPLHREIFLKILNYCTCQRDLSEVENTVTSYPEFTSVAQSPYRLIRTLVDAGGLHWLNLDENGNTLASQATLELTTDEIDELTFSYAIITTPVGEQVADELSPEKRLNKLFDAVPQRLSTYLDVMDYCREKHSFKEIEDFLRGRAGDAFSSVVSRQPLKPSFFVDTLERSGGLVWDDGWKITERGLHVLNEIR